MVVDDQLPVRVYWEVPLCVLSLFMAPFSFYAISIWHYKHQTIRNLLLFATIGVALFSLFATNEVICIFFGLYQQTPWYFFRGMKYWVRDVVYYLIMAIFAIFFGVSQGQFSISQVREGKILVGCAFLSLLKCSQYVYNLNYHVIHQENGSFQIDYSAEMERDVFVVITNVFIFTILMSQIIYVAFARYCYLRRLATGPPFEEDCLEKANFTILGRLSLILLIQTVPAGFLTLLTAVFSYFIPYSSSGWFYFGFVKSVFFLFQAICVIFIPVMMKWAIQRIPSIPSHAVEIELLAPRQRNLEYIQRCDPTFVPPRDDPALLSHVIVQSEVPQNVDHSATASINPHSRPASSNCSTQQSETSQYSAIDFGIWNNNAYTNIEADAGAINEGTFHNLERTGANLLENYFIYMDAQMMRDTDSGFMEPLPPRPAGMDQLVRLTDGLMTPSLLG